MLQGDEPERDDTTGQITEGNDETDVFTLKIGDCLNAADLETMVSTVPTTPCGEAHDSEVYAAMKMTDAEYPGDGATTDQADAFCIPEFGTFIGTPYETSELGYLALYPTQNTWDTIGDREILCIAKDEVGGLTATLAGAAR